ALSHPHSFPTRRSSDLTDLWASLNPCYTIFMVRGEGHSCRLLNLLQLPGCECEAAVQILEARYPQTECRFPLFRHLQPEKCTDRSEEHTSELQSPYDLV